MTRVFSPLFGTAASGRVGTLGSMRTRGGKTQFIQQAKGLGGRTAAQQRLRACFAAAKAAHSALPIETHYVGDVPYHYRTPAWPDFWRQWLADHEDCTA